jgi:hypothetical protein
MTIPPQTLLNCPTENIERLARALRIDLSAAPTDPKRRRFWLIFRVAEETDTPQQARGGGWF